ncbi:hypothetical protein JR316_0009299 [Psilocybe cubensis]|uniref:Uncharacterized protein n=2 Tax=Psilocybe cubensis TaxID=181762 RepID=A0ACB8GTT0_PSICU|nr:hypothetical protein JR316_0009299 [Psilocybe cubensis]KAH9478837.1 hypothetical protein JR316_0009299 [Psilocybe cubensis]
MHPSYSAHLYPFLTISPVEDYRTSSISASHNTMDKYTAGSSQINDMTLTATDFMASMGFYISDFDLNRNPEDILSTGPVFDSDGLDSLLSSTKFPDSGESLCEHPPSTSLLASNVDQVSPLVMHPTMEASFPPYVEPSPFEPSRYSLQTTHGVASTPATHPTQNTAIIANIPREALDTSPLPYETSGRRRVPEMRMSERDSYQSGAVDSDVYAPVAPHHLPLYTPYSCASTGEPELPQNTRFKRPSHKYDSSGHSTVERVTHVGRRRIPVRRNIGTSQRYPEL